MPGTSGILSPFGKIKGLYFDESKEPDDIYFQYMEDVRKISEEEGSTFIDTNITSKDDYYEYIDKLKDSEEDMLEVEMVSKEGSCDIVVSQEEISSGTPTGNEKADKKEEDNENDNY